MFQLFCLGSLCALVLYVLENVFHLCISVFKKSGWYVRETSTVQFLSYSEISCIDLRECFNSVF